MKLKICDTFVILTEWEEFKLMDIEESKIIFDGRNINQNKIKFQLANNFKHDLPINEL